MASSILLRKFTTTCTTASTFLTKLLHHHKTPSTTVFSPLTIRSFATTPTKANQENNNQQSNDHFDPPLVVTGPPEAFKYEHPFQTQGAKDVVEVQGTKDGTLVRLALPGVGENGYKIWVENDTVFFQAKADVDFKNDQPRTYGGSLQFQPEFNKAEGVKADIKNGILKLLVPNADGVDFEEEEK